MYFTHSFVAIDKGKLDYLFFYITEEYITEQANLTSQITPLLEEFGRNLQDRGALVKAFNRDIKRTNREVRDKWQWEQQELLKDDVGMAHKTPGFLIINVDFSEFNPKKDPWLYISFKEYLDDFGNVRIFDLKELLDSIAEMCLKGENVIEKARSYLKKQIAMNAHKMVNLKPGLFGISLDIKEAINFIRNSRK